MSIGNAVQRSGFVYIYDEKGQQTGLIPTGGQPGDGLAGYTSTTVNIRKGTFIYSYDEKGMQTAVVPAR